MNIILRLEKVPREIIKLEHDDMRRLRPSYFIIRRTIFSRLLGYTTRMLKRGLVLDVGLVEKRPAHTARFHVCACFPLEEGTDPLAFAPASRGRHGLRLFYRLSRLLPLEQQLHDGWHIMCLLDRGDQSSMRVHYGTSFHKHRHAHCLLRLCRRPPPAQTRLR